MSRVPGTFKARPTAPRQLPDDPDVGGYLRAQGALLVEFWVVGECGVIVAREPIGTTAPRYRWHLSISHPRRYPTWDEIKVARYSIPTVADVAFMAQLLPLVEEGQWTNVHDNCFHLYETTPDLDLRVT